MAKTISKVKDSAITALQSTIKSDTIIIANQKQQFLLLSENKAFKEVQIQGLEKRLIVSERKREFLKVGCISITVLGITSTIYFMFH